MKYIVISPYSKITTSGKISPKNYPFWDAFIELFRKKFPDILIYQIGTKIEKQLDNVDKFIVDAPFNTLELLIKECDCWFSVDNFLQHFCHYKKLKPGIVVWGPSDCTLFGYKENTNVYKGREFLRKNQFEWWDLIPYDPTVFCEPSAIIRAYHQYRN